MSLIGNESVFLTQWVHPFPFRTRKLSAAVAKILGWRRPGKIAHSRHSQGKLNRFPLILYSKKRREPTSYTEYSSLAQSVEHLTVNQVVAGSSPAGGAKNPRSSERGFFICVRRTQHHLTEGQHHFERSENIIAVRVHK